MRFSYLFALWLMCLLSSSAFARETRHFPFNWRGASEFQKEILRNQKPTGISNITLGHIHNELIVEGTPEALNTLAKQVEAFDVQIRVLIKGYVTRFDFDADGTWKGKILTKPSFSTPVETKNSTTDDVWVEEGQPSEQTTLTMLSRMLPDGKILIRGAFSDVRFGPKDTEMLSSVFARATRFGERTAVGFTHSSDPIVQKQARAGQLLTNVKKPAIVYYLNWKVTMQTPENLRQGKQGAKDLPAKELARTRRRAYARATIPF